MKDELSIRKNEARDCSVRALSIALSVPYIEAHRLCEKRGRLPKKGFHPYKAFKLSHEKKSAIYKGRRISFRKPGKHKPTIPTFIKKNPIGRFVCVKSRHAFAIIDGKLYGQALDNSRIEYYLKITINDNTSGQQELANANAIRSEEESIQTGCEQLDKEGEVRN